MITWITFKFQPAFGQVIDVYRHIARFLCSAINRHNQYIASEKNLQFTTKNHIIKFVNI